MLSLAVLRLIYTSDFNNYKTNKPDTSRTEQLAASKKKTSDFLKPVTLIETFIVIHFFVYSTTQLVCYSDIYCC
jgi:hypothetical protein